MTSLSLLTDRTVVSKLHSKEVSKIEENRCKQTQATLP